MPKHNIFRHGIKGRATGKYLTIIRNLFFKKFYINIFIFLVILIIFSVIILSVKRCPPPVVCPEPDCPECYCSPCPECPELDCSECPPRTEVVEKEVEVFYYVCPNGVKVNQEEDCNKLNLPFEITSSDSETAKNATLSLDLLEYEMKGDDWGTVTRVNVTIINIGEKPILPKILVRMYNPDDTLYLKKLIHREIEFEDVLMPYDWVTKSQEVSLSFSGEEPLVELELRDTIQDPDMGLVKVSKEITG